MSKDFKHWEKREGSDYQWRFPDSCCATFDHLREHGIIMTPTEAKIHGEDTYTVYNEDENETFWDRFYLVDRALDTGFVGGSFKICPFCRHEFIKTSVA